MLQILLSRVVTLQSVSRRVCFVFLLMNFSRRSMRVILITVACSLAHCGWLGTERDCVAFGQIPRYKKCMGITAENHAYDVDALWI